MLMGYWHGVDCAVVTGVIGPGVAAIHKPHSFEPDLNWQRSVIAEHYERSGRRETYLGDWHTHPGAITAVLSRADRRAPRRIIAAPKAWLRTPLMAVFFVGDPEWGLSVSRASLDERLPFFPKKLIVADMAVADC